MCEGNNTISIFEVSNPAMTARIPDFFNEDGIDVGILQQSPIQGSNNLNLNVRNYDHVSEFKLQLVSDFIILYIIPKYLAIFVFMVAM